MKKKLEHFKNKLFKMLKDIKEEQIIQNYFRRNTLFVTFLAVCLINSTMLRFFTMVTIENYLSIKPIIADLAILLIVGSFGFLIKPKNRVIYYFIWMVFFTAICMINSIYYTFYTSFASASMLALTQFIAPVADAVTENVLQLKDLTYLVGPIVFILVYLRLRKKNTLKDVEPKAVRKKQTFQALTAGGLLAFIFLISLTSLDISRFSNQWNREYIVMRFGIYIYQINDVVVSLKPRINAMFGYDQAMKDFTEYFASREQEEENKYTNVLEGMNIIAIHAESIQTFAMDLTFNGVEVTPNLNRIAREGLFFDNFYSQVSAGTSSDAELTFNASLMPTQSGTAFVSYSDRKYYALPNFLRDKGYYTFSMHANNADFWNRRVMHKNFGFDKFYAQDSYTVTRENSIGLGLSDEEFFRQSVPKIEKISESKSPFYGLMIMLTNHTPFSEVEKYGEFNVDIREKAMELNELGEEVETEVIYPYMEETKLGNYLKSVHYADKQLGLFMELMEEAGLLENTAIVIYGDHDARLPRKDFVRLYNYDKEEDAVLSKDDPNFIEFDSYQYELNRKVPFIIWTKEGKVQGKNSNAMGMIDILPTLGNMIGVRDEFALGRDIFNVGEDNIVVFPNGNWVTNQLYYNSQKGEYLSLNGEAISERTIIDNNEHTIRLLDISNKMIVFDLIKHYREQQALLNNDERRD